MNPSENIHYLFEQVERLSELAPKPSFDGGGGGGYDGGMEKRVEKLEQVAEKTAEKLTAIEQDIAVIKNSLPHYATKADISAMVVAMHSDINSQTWKLVTFVCSFGTALVAAVYYIATHVK